MKEGKEGRDENLLGKRIVEKKVNQERMRQNGEREKREGSKGWREKSASKQEEIFHTGQVKV